MSEPQDTQTPARQSEPVYPLAAVGAADGPVDFQLPQAKGLPQFDGPERRRLLSLL